MLSLLVGNSLSFSLQILSLLVTITVITTSTVYCHSLSHNLKHLSKQYVKISQFFKFAKQICWDFCCIFCYICGFNIHLCVLFNHTHINQRGLGEEKFYIYGVQWSIIRKYKRNVQLSWWDIQPEFLLSRLITVKFSPSLTENKNQINSASG